jgi:hypothetical protein
MMRRLRGALIRVVRYVPSHLPRHRGAARDAAPRPSKVGGFSRRRRLTRRPGRTGTGGATGCPRWRAQSPPGWLPARLLPRLEARRARRCLAPTQVGRASPVGRIHATVRRCALRPVGVRRCLTRPARRAGNPVVRRWAWWWVGRRGGRCMPRRMPRLEARRARQRLAPTQAGRSVPGVAYACADGWCIPPSGRGQAVPDPPARPGQQSSPRDDDRDTRIIDTSGQHRSARHSLSSEGARAPRGAARASHPPRRSEKTSALVSPHPLLLGHTS